MILAEIVKMVVIEDGWYTANILMIDDWCMSASGYSIMSMCMGCLIPAGI